MRAGLLILSLLAGHLCVPVTTEQVKGDQNAQDEEALLDGVCVEDDDCSTSRESVFRRSLTDKRLLDFLWFVECPCAASKRAADEYIQRVESSFAKWTQWSGRLSPDGHFRAACLAYSPLRGVALSSWSLSEKSPVHLCERVCSSDTGTNSSSSTKYDSTALILHLIYEILQGDAIAIIGGTKENLFLRPHADIHIIAIMVPMGASSLDTSKKTQSIRNKIEELIMKTKAAVLPAKMALRFFLDPFSAAARYIGDPKHAVRYRDCTHFNKALTLKSMIAGGERESSNFQAHLLSIGALVDVSDLADLSRDECIRSLNPVLWNPFMLESKMVDKCHRKSCPAKSFCSPIHGCVYKSQQRKSHDLDKAPLSGEFSTSHADLVKASKLHALSVGDKNTSAESLSFLQEPSSESDFSLADVVVGSPDQLQWSPRKSFVEKAIDLGEPLLIKDTMVTTWPAMTKWNMLYISENMGAEVLPAVKCTNTSLTFDPDVRAPLKLNLTLSYVSRNMSTGSFFSCIQHPSTDCHDDHSGHYYFGQVPEMLSKDLLPDQFLYNTEQDHTSHKQFIWISSPGMITHGHFDQDYNFFVQLIGEKRFTLWSPSQHELLSVFPRVHPMWHKSQINFRHPDIQRFPSFTKSRALQVTVRPGDVLFIPPYNWHYVETLSPSVSLSTWSHDYQLYGQMNSIYRHDHKFDLLQNATGNHYCKRWQ